MPTKHLSKLANAGGFTALQRLAPARSRDVPPGLEKRTILLISDDTSLHQDLRGVANSVGRMVVRVSGAVDTLPILYVVRPAAVLLDLDLPSSVAWETADTLLQSKACVPLFLITARNDRFEFRTSILAGCIVEKSAGPARLLEGMEQILAAPESVHVRRNALQQVVIRWLRPSSDSVAPFLRGLLAEKTINQARGTMKSK